MTHRFIVATAAAALAATSFTAAPAQADSNSVIDFLAGATALVILHDTLTHRHNRPYYVHRQVDIYHGDQYGGQYAYQREGYRRHGNYAYQRERANHNGGEFAYQREQTQRWINRGNDDYSR